MINYEESGDFHFQA